MMKKFIAVRLTKTYEIFSRPIEAESIDEASKKATEHVNDSSYMTNNWVEEDVSREIDEVREVTDDELVELGLD